jgi:hypothetical protein
VFTARYALTPYIKQIRLGFKGLTGRLLAGHNTLRRHLHIMGLLDSALCRKREAGEETSALVLCECEALATLTHIYLRSFFLDPEDVRALSLRAILNFFRRTGLSWLRPGEGHKGPVKACVQRDRKGSTHTCSYSYSSQSIVVIFRMRNLTPVELYIKYAVVQNRGNWILQKVCN